MSAIEKTLPAEIVRYLAAARRRAVGRELTRIAGMAVAIFLSWMAVGGALDRVLQLGPRTRCILLGVAMISAVVVWVQGAIRMRWTGDWFVLAQEVEHHESSFGQSLLTLVSQLSLPEAARGSPEFLGLLLDRVRQQIARTPVPRIVPLTRMIVPWALSFAIALLPLSLLLFPQVGVTRLAERFLMPLSSIPPATTTQLTVWPGDRDCLQNESVEIRATVQHLIGDSVLLNLKTQGDWYRVAMSSSDGIHYHYLINSIEHDLSYDVSAGDAHSPEYIARVLRRPRVVEFEIHYDYPPYLDWPGKTVSNTDGLIEAPAGTVVVMTTRCTAALRSATLYLGGRKCEMGDCGQDNARRARFTIDHDMPYSLDFISQRDVVGKGPPEMRIKITPVPPPLAHLYSAGMSLWLMPRQKMGLAYEASGELPLKSAALALKFGKNDMALPLPIENQSGSVSKVYDLDLATLPLKLGDQLSVRLSVVDAAGQTTTSEPVRINIGPYPVDFDTRQMITDLDVARTIAQQLMQQVQSAMTSGPGEAPEHDRVADKLLGADGQIDLSLTEASESANLLRQCLCRAILHTHDPALCTMLANGCDSAQVLANISEELFRERGDSSESGTSISSQFDRARELSDSLAQQLNLAWRGQLAAMLLSELNDWRATHVKDPTLLSQTALLGVSNRETDLAARLSSIAAEETSDAIAHGGPPIDFAALATTWAEELSRGVRSSPSLDRRLSVAAVAESLRPDADVLWAYDLELSSRAAAAISASLAERRPEESSASATVLSFANALRALAHAADARRRGEVEASADAASTAFAAAVSARQQLFSLAPDALFPMNPGAIPAGHARSSLQDDIFALALSANSAAAGGDYNQVRQLDKRLIQGLESTLQVGPKSSGSMQKHFAMDSLRNALSESVRLEQSLDQIISQLRESESKTKGDRLSTVLKELDTLLPDESENPAGNARVREADAIVTLMENLGVLSQHTTIIASVQSARLPYASPPTKVAAGDRDQSDRNLVSAQQSADAASRTLADSLSAISSLPVGRWASGLSRYSPETDSVCELLEHDLEKLITKLVSAANSGDEHQTLMAVSSMNSINSRLQVLLSQTLLNLAEGDPVLAARSWTRLAAYDFSTVPADLISARKALAAASSSAGGARMRVVQELARRRLALVPMLGPIFAPALPTLGQLETTAEIPMNLSNYRSSSRGAALGFGSSPAGYDDALRLYFQALAKAQSASTESRIGQ